MSAVLLAIFNDHATADRIRMELFQDGFPTDRVELTACCEPGRAALLPADCLHNQLVKYFRSLFTHDSERDLPEQFAGRVENGAATITVHPRGPVETVRVAEILSHADSVEIANHEMTHQSFEHAAARNPRPWVSNFWMESDSEDLCIYCRLFERGSRRLPS
jgi:hypothetical protein